MSFQSGTPAPPSRFDAVRALDEDENWRERTEVITKHDHNLNKQLASDIVEQIVDSAARWAIGELLSDLTGTMLLAVFL